MSSGSSWSKRSLATMGADLWKFDRFFRKQISKKPNTKHFFGGRLSTWMYGGLQVSGWGSYQDTRLDIILFRLVILCQQDLLKTTRTKARVSIIPFRKGIPGSIAVWLRAVEYGDHDVRNTLKPKGQVLLPKLTSQSVSEKSSKRMIQRTSQAAAKQLQPSGQAV